MEEQDTSIKTFNQAKKYAEELLFPMMLRYHEYQRQSDFGSDKLDISNMMSEEIRNIERYNGLKGSCEILYNINTTITSTVRLKGNIKEIKQLDENINILRKLKDIFYDKRDHFFLSVYKDGIIQDTLDRVYFQKIKEIIQICYINTEILMTKNKLLFSDARDDFKSDKEIMEEIKKEYAGE